MCTGLCHWYCVNGSSCYYCMIIPSISDICWGLSEKDSMVNPKLSSQSKICYRPIRPSDLDVLERIHSTLFPIRWDLGVVPLASSMSSWTCVYLLIIAILRYESAFFQDVVNGRDIVSWGAVDCSRPNGQSDELIGFVTARVVLAKESEVDPLYLQLYAFWDLSNYLKYTMKKLSVHHF